MWRKTCKTLLGLLTLSAVSFAADVTGRWTAMVPGRNGDQATSFTFKQDGDKLTGTVTNPAGELPIAEGKTVGDAVSSSVVAPRGKQKYTGAVSGDEIKFKREGGQGQPREFVAKRAQS